MNLYNQVPHLTQDTKGKVTHSQLETTNESQEVSHFPAGDHKAHINRRAQRRSKHKKERKKGFTLAFQETGSIHYYMEKQKIEFITYIYILYYQPSVNLNFSRKLAGLPDILN